MGVPHLIATLQPHAEHRLLRNERVVIDGPALAYHILHLCRLHNVTQPSYTLLGQTVISWLENLSRNNVVIDAIYFDGYLPPTKRPVRMSRCYKTNLQLNTFVVSTPDGCPESQLSKELEESINLFPAGRSPTHSKISLIPPAFLVPAVIDALRQSQSFSKVAALVMGEADIYCANHVASQGGSVLTSDSDLLAHDLNGGHVMFLRDIYTNADSQVACSVFTPSRICRDVGIDPDKITRLAYELSCAPNMSLTQLVKATQRALQNKSEFDAFQKQYIHADSMSVPQTVFQQAIQIKHLDPRVSELVLQLGQPLAPQSTGKDHVKVFLPHLIEDSNKGTAWESSTWVRQLAYTVCGNIVSAGSATTVEEYRRVQEVGQKGRAVVTLTKSASVEVTLHLKNMMSSVMRLKTVPKDSRWSVLCLALDTYDCQSRGKRAHALTLLHNVDKLKRLQSRHGKLAWDIMHLAAQLHAGLYSLRMLHQIFGLVSASECEMLHEQLSQLSKLLSEMPLLTQYPDFGSTFELVQSEWILPAFKELGLTEGNVEQHGLKPPDIPVSQSTKKRKRARAATNKSSRTDRQDRPTQTGNKFDLLPIDS